MPAFLVAEACIALMISAMCLTMLNLTIAQTKKVEVKLEYRADRAYAKYILNKFDVPEVIVHDHVYRMQGGEIIDAGTEK